MPALQELLYSFQADINRCLGLVIVRPNTFAVSTHCITKLLRLQVAPFLLDILHSFPNTPPRSAPPLTKGRGDKA